MNYQTLVKQIQDLTEGVPYLTANLSNTAAAICESMEGINWAGFYILEEGKLVLGPFQGKPACILIPMGRGVCGTCAAEEKTQLVPDVHQLPGHIACDSASNSEIVVPLMKNGQIWGVLDIDSPHLNRFTEEDRAGLEAVAKVIEGFL